MPDTKKQGSHAEGWDANEHYKDTNVATEYDSVRFSGIPGRVFNHWERSVILRAFHDIPDGSHIGDLPCGTGRLAESLLKVGYKVHGMDISSDMLEVAAQRLQRFDDAFTTEVVDAKKDLTGKRVKYDAILCARVLMHFELPEQIEFLRGVTKITSSIVVINHSLNSPYQRFRRFVKRVLGHQESARHPVTASEIKVLLAGAGLREVRHYRLNRLISEAIYIVAVPI